MRFPLPSVVLYHLFEPSRRRGQARTQRNGLVPANLYRRMDPNGVLRGVFVETQVPWTGAGNEGER